MKFLSFIIIAAALTFFYLGSKQGNNSNQQEESTSGWLTNYQEAISKSKSTNKPILINFTGSDWCGWCIRLKKEVFNTSSFKSWAKKKVILLEIDSPRKKRLPPQQQSHNQNLLKKFSVRGFPTVIVVNSSGKQLGRSGYVKGGPKAWIAATEKSCNL